MNGNNSIPLVNYKEHEKHKKKTIIAYQIFKILWVQCYNEFSFFVIWYGIFIPLYQFYCTRTCEGYDSLSRIYRSNRSMGRQCSSLNKMECVGYHVIVGR